MEVGQLVTLPLFADIQEEELEPLLHCLGAYEKKYGKGEMIFLETYDIRCVGIVLSGSVYMTKDSADGKKAILVHIQEGDIFGETFACHSQVCSTVSFEAAQAARVLFLPFRKMMHTCTASCLYHHRLIENMVRMLAEKNTRLLDKVEVITQRTLRDKILMYLEQEAQRTGSSSFTISFGRQELADYLCADRSALTRELYHMQDEGILLIDKHHFTLL